MFCKNCGNEMNPNAAVCVKCGCAKGVGNTFCPNCGNPTAANAFVCLNCGVALAAPSNPEAKSKVTAGLLALFLGGLGIHNFYLGYTKKAVIQLLISVLGSLLFFIGPVVTGIWALIDAIMIFTDKINVDAKGVPLKV